MRGQYVNRLLWPAAVAISIVSVVALQTGVAQVTQNAAFNEPAPQPGIDPLIAPQPTPATPGTPATAAAPAATALPVYGPPDSLDRYGRPGARQLPGSAWDESSVPADSQRPAENLRRMQQQLREAAAAIRNAPDEPEKARQTKRLADVLNEYFEEDVRRRETELVQIEERVKKLREQFSRRREKKQEIIDLQMKVALNEADGLGFFSQPGGAGPEYSSTMPLGTFFPPATDRTRRQPFERRIEGEPPRPGGAVAPPAGVRGNVPGPRPAPGAAPPSETYQGPPPLDIK